MALIFSLSFEFTYQILLLQFVYSLFFQFDLNADLAYFTQFLRGWRILDSKRNIHDIKVRILADWVVLAIFIPCFALIFVLFFLRFQNSVDNVPKIDPHYVLGPRIVFS